MLHALGLLVLFVLVLRMLVVLVVILLVLVLLLMPGLLLILVLILPMLQPLVTTAVRPISLNFRQICEFYKSATFIMRVLKM